MKKSENEIWKKLSEHKIKLKFVQCGYVCAESKDSKSIQSFLKICFWIIQKSD